MLEERIAQLNSSIIELIAVISNYGESKPVSEVPPEIEIEIEAEEPKSESPGTEIDLQDLNKLCLGLVRENPKNKTKIKKIISNFGGELIKDVPVANLADLKIALEAL